MMAKQLPDMDYTSAQGARILAARVQDYWRSRGYLITTWVERDSKLEGKLRDYWVVRSNLYNARPLARSLPVMHPAIL